MKIFEQLIRDAIALLVQRGEIKIPRKQGDRRRSSSKQKNSDPQVLPAILALMADAASGLEGMRAKLLVDE